MSSRSALRQSFRSSQLRQYFLEDVVATGKSLGVGSYGSVVEVEYKQIPCAAKQIHDLLFQAGNEGVRETVEKYRRECQLMASLRHPNITQFLGLCFLESSRLPLLVMERLEMSVDDLLECAPNIPLPVKLSILTDTCSGLVYLHGMESPIVHRDLTARNVLLTSSLSAKITDLGNSRIVNFRPGQLAQTLSRNPGTTVYMPPEALSESHRYGPSLDVFSFGHLTLYTLTQVFPGELLTATYASPSNPEQIIGRSEVERRGAYIETLQRMCGQSYPALMEIVRQCLHNIPERRPTTKDLLGRLRAVKKEVEGTYGGSMIKQLNIASVLHVKEMKEKDKRIQELQNSEERLEAEKTDLLMANERLEADKRNLLMTNERLEALEHESRAALARVNEEKERRQLDHEKEKDALITRHEEVKHQLEGQQQELETALAKLQQQLTRSNKLLEEKQRLLDIALHESQAPKLKQNKQERNVGFPLQLHWRRGPDMPFAMDYWIQSVEVEGTVYVGSSNDINIVMAYDIHSSKWHSIPPYSAKGFTMTTINNKLVLVGGMNYRLATNQLGVWQRDSNQWTYPFPSMPTPRYGASATSYKHYLVVAGGYNYGLLSTVEVLDVDNKQWSTAPSTPTPWSFLKSIIIGDIWYLLGGEKQKFNSDVYSVSLEALVTHSASEKLSIWKNISSLNCIQSCPLNIRGYLLAVGGAQQNNIKPISSIQYYVTKSNTWVQAGELPCAIRGCTSIMISDKIYVMGGYNENNRLSFMYIADIKS